MKLKIMTYNIASGRCYEKDEDVNAQGLLDLPLPLPCRMPVPG